MKYILAILLFSLSLLSQEGQSDLIISPTHLDSLANYSYTQVQIKAKPESGTYKVKASSHGGNKFGEWKQEIKFNGDEGEIINSNPIHLNTDDETIIISVEFTSDDSSVKDNDWLVIYVSSELDQDRFSNFYPEGNIALEEEVEISWETNGDYDYYAVELSYINFLNDLEEVFSGTVSLPSVEVEIPLDKYGSYQYFIKGFKDGELKRERLIQFRKILGPEFTNIVQHPIDNQKIVRGESFEIHIDAFGDGGTYNFLIIDENENIVYGDYYIDMNEFALNDVESIDTVTIEFKGWYRLVVDYSNQDYFYEYKSIFFQVVDPSSIYQSSDAEIEIIDDIINLNNERFLSLFNLNGQNQEINAKSNSINIAHLPPGLYFLITDKNTYKILKE